MSHYHPDDDGEHYTKCDAPHAMRTEKPHFPIGRRVRLALSRLRGQTAVDYWITHPLTPSERAFINQEYDREMERFKPRRAKVNIVHNPNVPVELFRQQTEQCPVCQQSWLYQSGDLMMAMSLTALFAAYSGEEKGGPEK